MSKRIHILFLCVANSARSQLAEGLAKSMFTNKVEVQSAGSFPSGKVQRWAIDVLKNEGIDISNNWSKSVEQLPASFLANLDFVITLCAEEICPVMVTPAKRIHWPIIDPAHVGEEQKESAFLFATNAIREKLVEFGKIHLPEEI